MRANRILFDKLKQQYDIIKMKSAYILAEREIMQNPGLTAWQEVSEPQEFHFMQDEFGNIKNMTVKELQIEKLEKQLEELERVGNELLAEEKYELMQEAKELYNITKSQLNKLRGL